MKKILFAIVALCVCACAQTPDALMPNPRIQFVDQNGVPLAGGFLHSYQAGTSTPLATYHIDTLGSLTPNQNPIVLDSTGSAEVRILPQAYKFVLEDSNHVQIWAVDQVEDVGQILYGQAVLLNPPGQALQVVSGPLQFTTLVLGGGTPLVTTNQSGTGNLCMATGCALSSPSINGIPIPNTPGTYIQIPNSSSPGTTVNKLTKFAVATPSWTKRNDQSGSGTGSPQAAAAFSTALTNPSLIVVFANGPVGTFSIADTAGNTFVDCGQSQIVFNSSANGVQCFYALNTHTTGSDSVSFSSTGGGAMSVTATEWTGGALSSPVDVLQNSGPNQSSGSGGGENVTSSSNTTNGPDLVIGMAGVAAGTLTIGTGFTASSNPNFEYQTQSGPSSVAATWHDNTDNDSYGALLAAFRPFAGSSSTASITSTTDVSGIQGVTVSGAGTSGNAVIQLSGVVPCTFDGPTNASDYVQPSSTIAGDCHDTGFSTVPSGSIQTMGRVLSTNSAAGTYNVELFGPEYSGAAGSGTSRVACSTYNNAFVGGNTLTTYQPLETCKLPQPGSLNAVGKIFRITTEATVEPGTSLTSAINIGLGGSPALGTYGTVALASSNTSGAWSTSFVATCMVTNSGTNGTLECSQVNITSGALSPIFSNLIINADLTGVLYVGTAVKFNTGNSANTGTSTQLIVEQLN